MRVDLVPMLVVNQGEVAVIKSYVGLPTLDTSGAEFKFGSIVRPGHRGIWQEPLRTGKYPLNPRIYAAEIVPTFILTLNWAEATSEAHDLDAQLSSILGKSREGFVFRIDLQVQIHVPDTRAPKVISMVGTMRNLVSEVLQSAVGNHFRNTLQALEAVRFIETRQQVQAAAFEAIAGYLGQYEVETKGVYIQDVVFPQELVLVLTQREIANQEKATYEEMQRAQTSRIEMEKAKGTADMQGQLASAQVGVQIKQNEAEARRAEGEGEAAYVEVTGRAEATKVQAIGLAEAKAVEALGVARATGLRGAAPGHRGGRDRGGRGGQRGRRGPHHRRARGPRDRGWRIVRGPRRDADASAHPGVGRPVRRQRWQRWQRSCRRRAAERGDDGDGRRDAGDGGGRGDVGARRRRGRAGGGGSARRGSGADLSALVLVARSLWRVQGRALVLLALLGGVGLGCAMTAAASARRADTAYDRLRAATNAPDVLMDGAALSDDNVAQLDALPEVAGAARFSYTPIAPAPLVPGRDSGAFVGLDDGYLDRVYRPLVRDGRLPRPGAPDEVVVNEALAEPASVSAGASAAIRGRPDRRPPSSA